MGSICAISLVEYTLNKKRSSLRAGYGVERGCARARILRNVDSECTPAYLWRDQNLSIFPGMRYDRDAFRKGAVRYREGRDEGTEGKLGICIQIKNLNDEILVDVETLVGVDFGSEDPSSVR